MLKVFIPLNVCKESGPLKVYDKINSKLARKETLFKNLKYFLLTGDGESIYCINPNMCFHQEGNPKKNFSSVQIMFQLNPSKKWSYRNDLYQRQFMREKNLLLLLHSSVIIPFLINLCFLIMRNQIMIIRLQIMIYL